jgi:hypothetical protein
MKLWEADHKYYCSESNYFSNDTFSSHKSWASFIAEEGDGDMDYNLVFRWDWREGGDWGAGDYTGDDNYRNGLLQIFYVGQRKGLFRCVQVDVCRADEPGVRAFLEPRLAHLMALWGPLEGVAINPATDGEVRAEGDTRPNQNPIDDTRKNR